MTLGRGALISVTGLLTVGALGPLEAACKKPPADPLVAARVPSEVLRLAPPPRQVRYERKRVVGAIGLPMDAVVQDWSFEADEPAVTYKVVTGIDAEKAKKVAQRMRYDKSGLSLVAEGVVAEDGSVAWESWDPPAVVLPAGVENGSTWEATHRTDAGSVPRSCEVMVSDLCGEGLVVVCDRQHDGFRLVTRDHFCPDQGGWAGYESLLVRPGTPGVRTWTEGVRRVD